MDFVTSAPGYGGGSDRQSGVHDRQFAGYDAHTKTHGSMAVRGDFNSVSRHDFGSRRRPTGDRLWRGCDLDSESVAIVSIGSPIRVFEVRAGRARNERTRARSGASTKCRRGQC